MSNGEKDGPAGRQFVTELLRELRGIDPDLLRGEGRFESAHELTVAPAQFKSILAIAEQAVAAWDLLPPEVKKKIEDQLLEVMDIVKVILSRPPTHASRQAAGAGDASRSLAERLHGVLKFFNALESPLSELRPEAPPRSHPDLTQELEDANAQIAELKAAHAELSAEVESRKDLVEAARGSTGSSGAEDLANAYEAQAEDHERDWKRWGCGLCVALVAALIGGAGLLALNAPPDNATTSELISHLAVDILVIGLLIYAVRLTSLQFSVHRHLQAVANNKAAALNTFARIVSTGSSADTRDRLAEVLAHHVFISDSTGFLDVASDQITLPERLVDPVAKRVAGG